MENQKITHFGRKIKFTISIAVLALLLLLAFFYSGDFLLREFYLALAFVAGLNVCRVISNNNLTV